MPEEMAQQPTATDGAFERMLARLPADVREGLTPLQCGALAAALERVSAVHLLDYRLSVRWLRRPYYARLMVGHERRSLSRLMREQQIRLGPTVVLLAMSIWLAVSVSLTALAGVLYLAKAAYGFDLFDGDSVLHACFFR